MGVGVGGSYVECGNETIKFFEESARSGRNCKLCHRWLITRFIKLLHQNFLESIEPACIFLIQNGRRKKNQEATATCNLQLAICVAASYFKWLF